MKLETFFEKFDQFANAPDAVTRMREIVLELAVHGKLNQGNSADENGWPIKRLKDLTTKIGSGSTPHGGKNSYHVNGTPLIRSMNVHFRKFVRDGLAFIDDVQASALSNVIVEPNDVLLNITGASIGRVTTAPEDMAGARVNQHVAIIRTKHELFPRFLEIVLASPTFQSLIDGVQVGATREALTKRMIEEFEIPLPATSEQISVISRVDELMALCDRLEAQQKEREARHTALNRASIARFDDAPTPANLNFLFHPSYSVTPADLRKSILSLAVQGKIAYQDPDEESGAPLLQKIVRDSSKQRFAKVQSITRDDSTAVPFKLPLGWSVARLGSILQPTRGISYGVIKLGPEPQNGGVNILRCSNVRFRRLDLNGMRKVTHELSEEYGRTILRGGEVLINVRGTLGGCALVPFSLKGFNIAREVAVVPVHSEMNAAFLLNVVASPYFQDKVNGNLRGIAYEGLNLGLLRDFLIPIPPFAEQCRIVAKVDQLMGLVDQLEAQLAASETTAKELLDAVVHELLHSTADVVEFPRSESDRSSQRAAIGCYAIEYLARNPSFGRTMLMKACYLSETHLGLPFGWQPMRQAAGPWDPWIEDFESLGTRSDWFTVSEKALNNGHSKIEYSPKKALNAKAAEAISVLGNQKAEFDRLLNLLADRSTEEAEIIATLFAAWNDFLIDGKTPTDDEIIHEVRENWHDSKGRFSPALLKRWLDWMRSHFLTPKGHGPRTTQQLKLALS